MDPTPFDLDEELRRHGGSLRRLARELVRDAAAADDAVQETWLHAVRRPPREGNRGGWLATVLRRVVARSRRGERRRTRREEAFARELVVGDHAEIAARTELAQRLIAAVHALEEPYRSAIWQRYFEELAPREIAARAGVPLATVKSRLQRGLQQLRERLGEGGESDWRGALVAAFGFGDGAVAASAAWQGGVLMATGTKVAAAVLVGGIAVWWSWPTTPPPTTFDAAAAPVSTVVVDSGEAASTAERVAAGAAEVAGEPESAVPPAQPSLAAAPVGRLRGRAVAHESGEPLSGTLVRLVIGRVDTTTDTLPEIVTGADGMFEFDVRPAPTGQISVELSCDDRVTVSWRSQVVAGDDEDAGDIALARGRRIHGRLVDVGGATIPADILVTTEPVPPRVGSPHLHERRASGHTSLGGAFVLEPPLLLGLCEFDLPFGEFELVERGPIEITIDEPRELELRVRRRAQIRGVVVDERGQPVAGASLSTQPGPGLVRAARDGSFTLLRLGRELADATTVFVCDTPGCEPHPPLLDVPWGTENLRIELRRMAPFAIEVVDGEGRPIEGFGVLLERAGVVDFTSGNVRQRGEHAEGRLTLDDVVRGKSRLRVLPNDRVWSPSEAQVAEGPEPMRIVLEKRVPLRVLVHRSGRPLPDVRVELVRGPRTVRAAIDAIVVDPSETHELGRITTELVAVSTTGGDGGAVLVRDRDLSGCWLRLQASGEPVAVRQDLAVDDEGVLRVDLPPFGSIAGRVLLRGRSHDTIRIEVPSRGFSGSAALRVARDGTFTVADVPAGPCRVDVLVLGAPLATQTPDVRAGDPTELTFDLAASPMASVAGRVTAAQSLPAGLHVTFLRLEGGAARVVTTAEVRDGRFEGVELPPGRYRTALRVGASQPYAVPALDAAAFEVFGGTQLELELRYVPRRLAVRMQRPDGGVVRRERVLVDIDGITWPSGPWRVFAPMVDEVLVLDPAPAVPLRFRNWSDGARWSEVVVMPPDRSEAEVTVVLPDPPR